MPSLLQTFIDLSFHDFMDFFDENNLSLANLVDVCIDRVPDKIANFSWLLAPVK